MERHDLRDRLISLIGHLGHALDGSKAKTSTTTKRAKATSAKKAAAPSKTKTLRKKRQRQELVRVNQKLLRLKVSKVSCTLNGRAKSNLS